MENYAEDPEIMGKTLDLIYDYVKRFYYNFATLQAHGIQQDDIVSDVCYYMYKVNKKGESFLDKMSKIKTEKHHKAFVKRSVMNTLLTKTRECSTKPIVASLDYTGESLKDYTDECLGESLMDRIPDPNAFVEEKVMESIAVNSIENKKYKNLVFYLDERHTKILETKDIVSWLIYGRTIKALSESIYDKENNKQVDIKYLKDEVKKITKQLGKELKNYYEE